MKALNRRRVFGDVRPSAWGRLLAVLLLFIFFCHLRESQSATIQLPLRSEAPYSVSSWRTRDGLPGNWVQSIIQTRDGYLWVGTREGLARFDGSRFTVFSHVNVPAMQGGHFKALMEDAEGNLWGASKKGAMMLSGGEFRFFTKANGLGADELTSICRSSLGGVWFGTANGVSLYRNGRFTNYTDPALRYPFVYSVLEDRRGTLWAGLIDGLYRLDAADWTLERTYKTAEADLKNEYGEDGIVRSLIEDKQGTVWFGTGKGLYRVEGDRVEEFPFSFGEGLPLHFTSVSEQRDGTLWVIAGHKLYERDAKGGLQPAAMPGLADAEVNTTFEDTGGNTWIGTRYHGLSRLQPRQFHSYSMKDGLPNNNVRSITQGLEGRVWIATDNGVAWIEHGKVTVLKSLYSTDPETACRCAVENSDGVVWFAMGLRAIACGLRVGGDYHVFGSSAGHPQSTGIYLDPSGDVWIGAKEGLTLRLRGFPRELDAIEGLPRLSVDHSVGWHFRPGERGFATHWSEWLEAPDGSWRRKYPQVRRDRSEDKPPSRTLTESAPAGQLTHYDVRAILRNRQGTLWIGTAGGGLNFVRDGKFEAFTKRDGLGSDHVFGLHEDAQGALWIATRDGLTRRKDSRFRHFTTSDGLADIQIKFLVEDDSGFFWLGSNHGVSRVSRAELNDVAEGRAMKVQSIVFTEEDGLPSDECNGEYQPVALKDSDGRIWIPTTRGIGVIDPRRIRYSELTPPVAIEGLVVNERPAFASIRTVASPESPARIDPGGSLLLLPGSGRFIEIQYTANCLSASDRVQFRFRLEGNEKDWRDVGNRRTAYYNNLKPGPYRFHVAACNAHGVWNAAGASLTFVIQPFFWQTRWFVALLIGTLLLAVALVVRWRLTELRRLNVLEQQNAVFTERQRIARDMHDDMGARLNRLSLLSKTQTNLPKDVVDLAHESALALDEIVWATHPGNDSLPDFADYLAAHAADYLNAAGLRLELDFPDHIVPTPLTSAQRHDLLLASKEALRNIVQHARASAVWMRLSVSGSGLKLEIEDNGIGISHSDRPGAPAPSGRHNGLSNMRHRIEKLSGRFEVVERPGGGTIVRFQVRITSPIG